MIPRHYLRYFVACVSHFVLAFTCSMMAAAQQTTSHGKARVFADPAPPRIEKLSPIQPLAPSPHPDVKVHAKPKPLPRGAVTHDWKAFLGPTHNAVSTETKLLKSWSASGPTLLWEMRKGTGYSSPAVAGERLVYLHRVGNEEIVECLHPETGARYWKVSYPTQFADRYGYNNGPRASPVIDGDRVYTIGAEGKLHCLKLETGQRYWKRDIAAEFKVPQDFFGVASTPLIEGDALIVNVGCTRRALRGSVRQAHWKNVVGCRRTLGRQLCFAGAGRSCMASGVCWCSLAARVSRRPEVC